VRNDLNSKPRKQSIFVTGGSGGLGRALALHHAQDGTEVSLWGRSSQRLFATKEAVEEAGGIASTTQFDLMDTQAAIELMLAQDENARFDCAYLVAGIGDTRAEGEMVESTQVILRAAQLNFAAPAAMAAALAERMAQRGGGRIVLIGSAAAHHSLPFAAAYSGSKSGLARFADALRISMKPHGVSVTLASPGFIDTAAGRAGSASRPFELPVNEAARRIAKAAKRRKAHYITPWPFAVLKSIDRLLPGSIRDRILAKIRR